MPISGTAGAVISVTKMGEAVGDYLKLEGPADLRARNDKRLGEMGVSQDLTKRFLDHKSFTPRHQTIITEALDGLGGARGREVFLEATLSADDEVDSNYQCHRSICASTTKRLTARLNPAVAGVFIAQSQSGPVVIPFPSDLRCGVSARPLATYQVVVLRAASTQVLLW